MSDHSLLLDHSRRYFTQAGQASDIKKMKMLAELGLEFLELAQNNGRPRARAGAPSESAGTPPAWKQDAPLPFAPPQSGEGGEKES